jgi:cyanophycinase
VRRRLARKRRTGPADRRRHGRGVIIVARSRTQTDFVRATFALARWSLALCAVVLHAACALAPPDATAQAAPAASTAAATARAPAVPHGYAVPIGGALGYDNDLVWSKLVGLSGGAGSRWVVFATASGDPAATGERIASTLRRHGAVAEVIPVAPQLPGADLATAVRDPRWIDAVRSARGVFFSGGAQERIVDTLEPGGVSTPLLDAIRGVQRDGGVIAGTSAGAAIMSARMFRDAVDVIAVLKGALRDGQETGRGLGFVGPDVLVDQHFLRRGRIARLLPAMAAYGASLGLGVDEDTAAIVQGDLVEVIGARGVLVVDLEGADAGGAPFALRGARLSYLESGDRYDLKRREVLPSPAKLAGRRLDPAAAGFSPYFGDAPFLPDVTAEGALTTALVHVVDGRTGEVRALATDAGRPGPRPELGFEFRLHRGPDTLAWFTSATGREAYTIANVRLDVTPVRVATPLYTAWPK